MEKVIEIEDVNDLINDINKRTKKNGIEYELDIRETDTKTAASLFYKSNSNNVKLPVYTRKLSMVSLKEIYCILIGLDNAIQSS